MASPSSSTETLETSVGTAQVLHRLALSVVCIDAITERVPSAPIRVGREARGRFLASGSDPSWPCVPLDTRRPSRGVLRFGSHLPTRPFVLRLADPSRRYVARRLGVTLWDEATVRRVDHEPDGVLIPANYRLLQPWLLPGTAYPLPQGATAIRGRVSRNGHAVRWARVLALGPGNVAVGRAHADDRGEFLLVLTNTGTMPPPAPSSLTVRLRVRALRPPPVGPPVPPNPDRFHDLVAEEVPRAPAPPAKPPPPAPQLPTPPPPDLQSSLIRGEAYPTGYIPSTVDPDPIDVEIGTVHTLPADIPFAV